MYEPTNSHSATVPVRLSGMTLPPSLSAHPACCSGETGPARTIEEIIAPTVERGLGDGLFEWFRKWLAGEGFDQAVMEVHWKVRAKYYPWYCWGYFYMVYRCLLFETVRRVLASYMANVIEGKCQEWTQPRTSTWTQAQKDTVYLTAKRAAVYQYLAFWCLTELYEGTMDGDIIDASTLRPVTAPRSSTATPEQAASLDNSSDVFDGLFVVGIAVVTIAGIYGVTRLIESIDKVKS